MNLSIINYAVPVYPPTQDNLHRIWSSQQIWRQPDDVNESLIVSSPQCGCKVLDGRCGPKGSMPSSPK
eukprot:1126334-Prorocentrum_lima.AAC.1